MELQSEPWFTTDLDMTPSLATTALKMVQPKEWLMRPLIKALKASLEDEGNHDNDGSQSISV